MGKRILQYVFLTNFKDFALNVFEFITNLHDQINEQEMLESAIKQWKCQIFSLIIVDFSCASINAILEAFNRINVVEYCNILFDQVLNKTKRLPISLTKVGLCSAHFMHLLSEFLERHLKDPIDFNSILTISCMK